MSEPAAAAAPATEAVARGAARAGMTDTNFLRDIFANGPVDVGLAAGTDTFNLSSDGLFAGSNITPRHIFKHSFARMVNNLTIPAEAKTRLGAIAVASIAILGRAPQVVAQEHLGATGIRLGGGYWANDDVGDTLDRLCDDSAAAARNADAVMRALTCVAAMKVNWFSTNHHTGQGSVQGYALKVIVRLFTGIDGLTLSREAIDGIGSVMWRIGHLFDTKVVLGALGVPNVTADAQAVRVAQTMLKPTDDVTKRIRAKPAGAARLADCDTAIKILASSDIATYLKLPIDAKRIHNEHRAVLANPARYHPGAFYLTGEERIDAYEPSPETLVYLGVFLAVTRPSSTLKGAACFKDITDGYDRELAANIRAVVQGTRKAREDAAKSAGVVQGAWNDYIKEVYDVDKKKDD